MKTQYTSHPPVFIPGMKAAYISEETGAVYVSNEALFTITTTSVDLDTGKSEIESSEVRAIDTEFGFLTEVGSEVNFICFVDDKQSTAEIYTAWTDKIKKYLDNHRIKTQKQPHVNQ